MSGGKLALCVMPYHSARYGSIQCGLLKSVMARAGVDTDVHYFNLPFAKLAGLPYYETLAHGGRFLPEWSFSQALHGRAPKARAEARKRLDALKKRRGFDPKLYWALLDEVVPFLDECFASVDWTRYRLVGFSSVFQSQLASLALAQRIKRAHPGVKVVFGGPNVEGEMGAALLRAFPFVDYVVDGEGEDALLALWRALEEGSEAPLPRVLRRGDEAAAAHGAPVALDGLPFPDYDDYFAQLAASGLDKGLDPRLYFESARGCWWGQRSHCAFCGLDPRSIGYRSKSGERVLAELRHLSSRYKVCQLDATDNILDLRYLDTLFPRLKALAAEDGTTLDLFYETKSNLRREQVRALGESGVRRVQPGIESFDSGLLAAMGKGVSGLQNAAMLRACREFGVDANWLLLYGFPGEGERHHRRLLELLPRLAHLQPPDVMQRWLLDRFSPYFREPEKWGIEVRGPQPDYALLYPAGADAGALAYRFDYSCASAPPEDAPGLPPLKDFVARWQDGLAQRCFFHFQKGPGFARLYDHRPRRHDAQPSFRSLLLSGWRAEAYARGVDALTAAETLAAVRSGAEEPLDEAAMLAQFEAWDREGLGVLEGRRFLSLALPMPRDAKAFLERCQLLLSLQSEELSPLRA